MIIYTKFTLSSISALISYKTFMGRYEGKMNIVLINAWITKMVRLILLDQLIKSQTTRGFLFCHDVIGVFFSKKMLVHRRIYS